MIDSRYGAGFEVTPYRVVNRARRMIYKRSEKRMAPREDREFECARLQKEAASGNICGRAGVNSPGAQVKGAGERVTRDPLLLPDIWPWENGNRAPGNSSGA
jgi:hypothetical protein